MQARVSDVCCRMAWCELTDRPRRAVSRRVMAITVARVPHGDGSRALDLAPTIQELQAAGCESLRAIAAGLEERGIPAARGGKWSAVQVSRLLEAAMLPFDASEGANVAA
jgi:Recombinase